MQFVFVSADALGKEYFFGYEISQWLVSLEFLSAFPFGTEEVQIVTENDFPRFNPKLVKEEEIGDPHKLWKQCV